MDEFELLDPWSIEMLAPIVIAGEGPMACPGCAAVTGFSAGGRWGDPVRMRCRCGRDWLPFEDDPELSRELMKELIIAAQSEQ
ncbi:hypothetical protein [Streptomyces sp. NPDC054863]